MQRAESMQWEFAVIKLGSVTGETRGSKQPNVIVDSVHKPYYAI